MIEAASRALIALDVRPAEPGEFTRRAFQNGRMDLAQAEAVADLIDAETEAQKAQALGQLDGALSAAYAGFRRDLLKALSLVEAEIDFPDEEVPDNLARTAGRCWTLWRLICMRLWPIPIVDVGCARVIASS